MMIALTGCPFEAKGELVLSGTAYHAASKKPFDGALVIGIYKQCRSGFAATSCFCVRTAAVRTGPDGVFKFPVTPTEGAPRLAIFAPNHYLKDFSLPTAESQRLRDKASYIDWNLWIATQDPENPDFRYESGNDLPCQEPVSTEAARAGLEFAEATKAERARLLQVLVDSARRKPLAAAKKLEVERMEYDIDVMRLGNAAAEEKRLRAREFRTIHTTSRTAHSPEDLANCFSFTDKSRTPLLAEALKKEQIKFELQGEGICVRPQDSRRVGALQSATP